MEKTTKEQKLNRLYEKYDLALDQTFKHQYYSIITRSGIDKIQGVEKIKIEYDVIECKPNFAVVKARAEKDGASIETFGSALVSENKVQEIKRKEYDKIDRSKYKIVDDIVTTRVGNCNTWYVMEMAEKRAMSRAVLKLTGFYELGAFGEDESEDFKRR